MDWLRKLFGRAGPRPVGPGLTFKIPRSDEPVTVHGDQILRKEWAEDMLEAEGVPVNPHLPMIESEATVRIRSAREVADRLLALAVVASKGGGLDQAVVDEIVAERGVRPLFTPAELAFIDDPDPSLHDRTQFSWRYEAAWVLLWALRYIDGPLGRPDRVCDVPRLAVVVRDETDLARHGTCSANDILNEADLIYRYHWAVRQAGLDGNPPPAGLDPGVVMERHHALNWLIGYFDADWDDVTTDT